MTHHNPAQADDEGTPRSAAAKLFDIRILIGGLFVVYGVMLTIAGFTTSKAEKAKAAGLNINLYLGLGMLLLGSIFLVWRMLNPIRIEADPTDTTTAAPAGGEAGRGH